MLQGHQSWKFNSRPVILSSAAVVGPFEGRGPLAQDFDLVHEDIWLGQESYEKAEKKFLEQATELAIQKAGLKKDNIHFFLSGDLMNQIISSSFTARTLGVPFLGVFGACSSSMEGLACAALLVDSGSAEYVLAGTSSHNAAAEKTFRYPTEYGSQKPPTAQWTVTGAGAAVVSRGDKVDGIVRGVFRGSGEQARNNGIGSASVTDKECQTNDFRSSRIINSDTRDAVTRNSGNANKETGINLMKTLKDMPLSREGHFASDGVRLPKVIGATIGRVIDMGISDPFNMGAAMAPAAVDTIEAHFRDFGVDASHYDLIATGDLGRVGHVICADLLSQHGFAIPEEKFTDCGLLIYDKKQPVFAGGSGCGCSATVTYGHFMRRLREGELKRILVVATGALLSPISYQQKETIPCIAHAVAIEM